MYNPDFATVPTYSHFTLDNIPQLIPNSKLDLPEAKTVRKDRFPFYLPMQTFYR